MVRKTGFNIDIFCLIFLTAALLAGKISPAQGLNVMSQKKQYIQAVQADSFQRMVDVFSLAPGIVYEPRYATDTNFTGTVLYKQKPRPFLRLAVAKALAGVQQQLQDSGLGLKIWDAYRPYAATKKMWDLIGDERYVANPANGSGHNRGLAVDLTLINLATKEELPMGTGFDAFTDSAHHSFTALPQEVLQNRRRLKMIMESHGFRALQTEWWHYSFPNDRNYAALDLPFKKL